MEYVFPLKYASALACMMRPASHLAGWEDTEYMHHPLKYASSALARKRPASHLAGWEDTEYMYPLKYASLHEAGRGEIEFLPKMHKSIFGMCLSEVLS